MEEAREPRHRRRVGEHVGRIAARSPAREDVGSQEIRQVIREDRDPALQPVVQLQGLIGREKNDASPVRSDLSRDLYTLRAGVSLTPAPKWGVSVGASYTKSRFKGPDTLFLTSRDDDYYGFDAGLSYRWTKQMSIKAEYTRSDNQSNISLYEYDRNVLAVKLRYEFR